MQNWKQVKKELLKDKRVKVEYDKLKPRYLLISQVIEARVEEGLTQSQLAKRAGTKQSAIARLESGSYNPSISFLEKISQALGRKLVIQLR